MKILIPNATSPKNLGDRAMLESLIHLVKETHAPVQITVHSADPHIYGNFHGVIVQPSLLQWLAFEEHRVIPRIFRVLQCVAALFVPGLPVSSALRSILADYRGADEIAFVGNGYLRSRNGISQSVYLGLLLLPYLFALRFRKNVYIAPFGFGPFAYSWQAKLCIHVFHHFTDVRFREPISLALAKQYGLRHARLAYDHAFFTPEVVSIKKQIPVIGVSLRSWNAGKEGEIQESAMFESLRMFATTHTCRILPVVQVNAPEHHDDDARIAGRLYTFCKRNHISAGAPVHLTSVRQAARVYGSLDLLIGMRMHANIIALSQCTPVVAIAYEHKTTGIMRMIGLSRYSIPLDEVTALRLSRLMHAAFTNRKRISRSLKKRLGNIRK